jgi:hypothetical protein
MEAWLSEFVEDERQAGYDFIEYPTDDVLIEAGVTKVRQQSAIKNGVELCTVRAIATKRDPPYMMTIQFTGVKVPVEENQEAPPAPARRVRRLWFRYMHVLNSRTGNSRGRGCSAQPLRAAPAPSPLQRQGVSLDGRMLRL